MSTDNNIEAFFRKHLEEQKFVYQESDWLRLEKKLDAAFPSNPSTPAWFPVKYWVWIAIALTLAFLLGWFARELFKEKNMGDLNKSGYETEVVQEDLTQMNNAMIIPDAALNDGDTDSLSDTQASFVQKKSSPIEKRKTSSGPVDNSSLSDEVEQVKGEKEIRTPPALKKENSKKINGPWVNPNGSNDLASNVKGNANPGLIHYLNAEAVSDSRFQTDPGFPGTSLERRKPLDIKKYSLPTGDLHIQTHQRNLAKLTPHYSRWALGISLAPDFNSVGKMEKGIASAQVGLRIYYSFLERWSVYSGILFNDKKYITNAENYSPPQGYWDRRTNGVLPESINGSCKVIDIPVMASYRLLDFSLFDVKVAGGFSNYIMLDEYYDFEFDQYNPGAASGWWSDENSRALLSTANFGVVLEHNLSKRFYLSIEPYVKIPLKKIGWGNVEMFGMGSLFSLKYSLPQF